MRPFLLNKSASMVDNDVLATKKNIGMLFDRIASKYDLLNHLLTFNIDKLWRKKASQQLDNKTNNLLDVAVGTGDMAILIAQKQKAQNIIGIDLSNQMIEIAKKKVKDKNLTDKINLKIADCQNLGFEDNSFDAITCSFGVRNFSNLNKGLQEMLRVLKPKGKLVILEFSYPTNIIIKAIYNLYFTIILPIIGKILSKDKTAYKYLPSSVKHFIYNQQFADKLTSIGFDNAKYQSLSMGICCIYTATKR